MKQKRQRNKDKVNRKHKIVELNTTILVFILNGNGLHFPTKRLIVSLGTETRPSYILFIRDILKYKDTDTSKAKGLAKRRIMPKVKRSVTRDEEGPCIIVRR